MVAPLALVKHVLKFRFSAIGFTRSVAGENHLNEKPTKLPATSEQWFPSYRRYTHCAFLKADPSRYVISARGSQRGRKLGCRDVCHMRVGCPAYRVPDKAAKA